MFNYLDTQSLLVLGLSVAVAAFFVGSAMNSVLEHMGFGTIGNMVVLIAGAFLGFYIGGMIMPYANGPVEIAVSGVCGAFLSLAVLAMLKAALSKFGF